MDAYRTVLGVSVWAWDDVLKCTERGQMELSQKEEILDYEGGEALEQMAQRSSGCPITGSVKGQVGWSSELLGLVEGVLTMAEDDDLLRFLPAQTILGFCDLPFWEEKGKNNVCWSVQWTISCPCGQMDCYSSRNQDPKFIQYRVIEYIIGICMVGPV